MTLTGCAGFPRPLAKPEIARISAPETRTVDDGGSAASVDIDAGFMSDDLFMLKPVVDSAPLPEIKLSGLSLTESGVYDTLRLVLKDTGISLNIEGGSRGSERFGPVSAFDVKGTLKEVLDNLSETIGFFYSFRKNTLFVQQEQQFVVELPPALSEDNAAGLTNTLQFLGAHEPYIDRLNRSLVFKTNRPSLAKIEGYLQKIRDTRALIIYDVNIFQVDLKDNSDIGIQWNKLGWIGTGTAPNPVSATGTTAPGLTSLGLGLVLSGTKFSVDMLIDFLQTQGNVKAISRPRLAVISGTRGSLRVGQSTTYVSKVGTNFSTSVNQVTTETKDLKTGLDLALFGDFSDNTIYTRIGLAISEIVSLNKFTALGTDLTLPTTADREINTVVRARPGDMILLGGIVVNRDSTETRRGITQNGNSDVVARSELVLAMKAKIVNFRGKSLANKGSGGAVAVSAVAAAVTVAPAALPAAPMLALPALVSAPVSAPVPAPVPASLPVAQVAVAVPVPPATQALLPGPAPTPAAGQTVEPIGLRLAITMSLPPSPPGDLALVASAEQALQARPRAVPVLQAP